MPPSAIWVPPQAHFCLRMCRHIGEPVAEYSPREFERAGIAVRLVTGDLQAALDTIDPQGCPDAFGPRIHQLLLSACSEVEAACAGILRANSYQSQARLTTVDYVKLATPMRLEDYLIRLEGYSDYKEIRPFLGWDENQPTQSLPWYYAYNAVKHDREANAHRGTVRHAISACSAVLAIATAQFGQDAFLPDGKFGQKILYLEGVGAFTDGEVYVPPPDHDPTWRATPYRFT